MKTRIYVIVHVTFDFHRFQKNLGADTTLPAARAIAKVKAKALGNLPICSGTGADALSEAWAGIEHIWIQKF